MGSYQMYSGTLEMQTVILMLMLIYTDHHIIQCCRLLLKQYAS